MELPDKKLSYVPLDNGNQIAVINLTSLDSQVLVNFTRVVLNRLDMHYKYDELSVTYVFRHMPGDPYTMGSMSDDGSSICVFLPKALFPLDALTTLAHEISHYNDCVDGVVYNTDLPYDERPEELRARSYAAMWTGRLLRSMYHSATIDTELQQAYDGFCTEMFKWGATPWEFLDWLSFEGIRQDAVGDLSRDVAAAIGHERKPPSTTRVDAWQRYLHDFNACQGAYYALDKALSEWRAINKRVYTYRSYLRGRGILAANQ